MSKITITIGEPKKVQFVKLLPVRTAFTGTVGNYTGTFLTVFDHVLIFLDDPGVTWGIPPSLKVQNFVEVDLQIIATPCKKGEGHADTD